MIACAVATFAATSETTAFFSSRLRPKVHLHIKHEAHWQNRSGIHTAVTLSPHTSDPATFHSGVSRFLFGVRHLRRSSEDGGQKTEDRNFFLRLTPLTRIKPSRVPTVFDNPQSACANCGPKPCPSFFGRDLLLLL